MRTSARTQRQQCGTAYVLVVAVTTLLITVGIAATRLAQAQIDQSETQLEQARVRLAALTAQDLIHKRHTGNLTWRQGLATGHWYPLYQEHGVAVSYAYTDPIDGVLDNDYTDPFELQTMAVSGHVRRIYSVTYTADSAGNLRPKASTMQQQVLAK